MTAPLDAGARARLFDGLPDDVAGLAGMIQGLLIHEHMVDTYGVTLSDRQRGEPHVRGVEAMLESIIAHDPRPLSRARPPNERFAGCCRHFTTMLVAMLRHKGIEARARCGFATYFTKGLFVDHWVAEYFDAARRRWVLVDAEIDPRLRELFGIDFDTLDVPRDRFLVAGEAWRRCRDGEADPGTFGVLDMFGLWFVASNVIRDVTALADRPMLPWDVWGAMTLVDADIDTGLIDRLAISSRAPDADPAALRAACDDPRVRVPGTVFNAVLGRPETVSRLPPPADSP